MPSIPTSGAPFDINASVVGVGAHADAADAASNVIAAAANAPTAATRLTSTFFIALLLSESTFAPRHRRHSSFDHLLGRLLELAFCALRLLHQLRPHVLAHLAEARRA